MTEITDMVLNILDDLRRAIAVLLVWLASVILPTVSPADVRATKHLISMIRLYGD